MEQLDLRLVRYFVVLAEELHFGRAAKRLHIAQPSLSQQIRRLESQLGVALLIRTSRRVELTPAGVALQRQGERLLRDAERTVAATRKAGEETLTIGFYGSAAMALLPSTLKAFTRTHPSTPVTIRELLFGSLDDLTTGAVDLAFTRLRADQVEDLPVRLTQLSQEPRVLALPRSHRFADRSELTLAELDQEAFVVNPAARDTPPVRWLSEQHRHGLPGRATAEARSVSELLAMVAAGTGITFVPAAVAQHHQPPDIVYVPVLDAEPAVISLAWAQGSLRPSGEAFIETARAEACGA
jgi:DNA-binding transcriptional LysR family regulator